MVLSGVFARHFMQSALVPLSSSCAHLDRYHGDYKWVGELFHSFVRHSTLSAMFVATVGTRCGWGRTIIAVQVWLQNRRPSTSSSRLSVSAGNHHIWPNCNRHQEQHCLLSTHVNSKWVFTLVVYKNYWRRNFMRQWMRLRGRRGEERKVNVIITFHTFTFR